MKILNILRHLLPSFCFGQGWGWLTQIQSKKNPKRPEIQKPNPNSTWMQMSEYF
jgi:hypothetical protein